MRDWYFQVMGQELGPFNAAELKSKVETGQIQRDTMVRRGVEGKWLFAERVKGLLPEPEHQPPAIPLRMKPKSSTTLPVVEDTTAHHPGETAPATQPRSSPTIIISLNEEDPDQGTKPPSVEFYDFVGFREAISPVLNRAVRKYLNEHSLTMTQLNRQALAAFIARPELAGDLMITNMAVITQQVNEKSNANGRDPLVDDERVEHTTIRVTIFNCSTTALDVTEGEFLPELVEKRDYEEVGTKVYPPLDHKGHVSIRLDGVQEGATIRFPLKITVQAMSAATLLFWFRGTAKPSLTRVRGHLRLHADDGVAYSEHFTIIMHGDSPG
ncbi:MAG: hypothetical protein JWP89_4234 [Schlesneria sp.]|nr:hypothetical protein [Schlesneria sp.]